VQAEPFGFEPRFTFLRFRGFDATQNGLFRDGLQLRNPGFAVSYNLEPYGAEEIDVLRGPASFLYGQGSPGGLLNYITKRPTRESLHEVQFLTGNFGRHEGRFDFGGKLNDSDVLSFRLTGLFRESGTQLDQVPNDRIYIAPAVTWQAAARTQITFSAHFQKDQLGSSQALPAEGSLRFNSNGRIPVSRFTGHPDIEKQNRTESSLGYEVRHGLAPDWDVVHKLRYSSTELDGLTTYSNSFGTDKRTVSRFAYGSLGKLNALTIDNQVHGKFSTGPFQHQVLGGLDFQRITVDLRQTFGAATDVDIFNRYDYGAPFALPPVFLNQRVTQLQTGVYLQDQVKLYDHWLLTLGGRHDWASDETQDRMTGAPSRSQADRKATGRAALTYLFDNGLAPYISYSTFFLPAIGVNSNGQAFTPETGRQYELGIKYQIPRTRTLLTAALFDLPRENFIQTDPSAFLQVQRGKARSRGLELEGVASFDSGLDVIASFTLLDNEVRETANPLEKGKRLPQTPGQFGSLWVKYTFSGGSLKGFGIGGGARYTGYTYGD
ncbi:MAG: TonB-dependent siderophore receptor, partial [Nitrospira sp.]